MSEDPPRFQNVSGISGQRTQRRGNDDVFFVKLLGFMFTIIFLLSALVWDFHHHEA